MISWDFFGILLQIGCGMVGGVCSFLLLNWAILRLQLALQWRVGDLENRVTHEVKVRASEMSRRGKNVEMELLEQLKNAAQPPTQELTLESWRKNKFGSI